MIPNLFEFYDLEAKQLDLYGENPLDAEDGSEFRVTVLENIEANESGRPNVLCDFDKRTLDLEKHKIFDARGNLICKRFGVFRDKNGNRLDLPTSLLKDSQGTI